MSIIKDGPKLRGIMRLDELSVVVRLELRTTKGICLDALMRLESVFILETHNQTNYKIFAQFRPDG